MISELITYCQAYLKSKSPREARAFGHLYEAIALVHREKRCQNYWASHRKHCKEFIEQSALRLHSKQSVLILGSGPLHEIPLEILAKNFSRVDLVDMVHLDSVKKKWKHLTNVRFLEADVTELESDLIRFKKPLEKIPSAFLNDHYDLVISANLLSQLSLHLKNYLEKKAEPKLSEERLNQFGESVARNHLAYLQKFECPVILITDIETQLLNKHEEIVEKETFSLHSLLPAPAGEWWWNVAPIPEYSTDVAVRMKVAGFLLHF